MAQPLIIICAVGLTPEHIGSETPALNSLAGAGFTTPLVPALPAVTTTAQTTMLTGVLASVHGIVGNGWYFRDLGEVLLWRQSEGLVDHPCVWTKLRQSGRELHVMKHFWWYAMNSDCDSLITPRPAYHADGAKSPDFYTHPASLHDKLIKKHGPFPLFNFWGPTANIVSTRWIAESFITAWRQRRPDLALCYLPHLDYDLQRYGPTGSHLAANLRDLDACIAPILAHAKEKNARVLVVSEYGIEAVDHGVMLNRTLREQGLLQVTTNATGELLDPGTSAAFAVCDHQIAHVYCHDEASTARAAAVITGMRGVERVYRGDERAEIGLDHPRSGELVVLAEAGSWFVYDYWLEAAKRPDFANNVEIHKKPGYDPRELFFDPAGGKRRAAVALLRKKLGFRYRMNPVPLDPSLVKGSHGRLPSRPECGPLLIADSTPAISPETWHQADIATLIQAHFAS